MFFYIVLVVKYLGMAYHNLQHEMKKHRQMCDLKCHPNIAVKIAMIIKLPHLSFRQPQTIISQGVFKMFKFYSSAQEKLLN